MKKKNLFSLVALATLTLGSCTNDEVVNDYSQDNAIQFGTYMGRDVQGRGAELTTDNLADFGVFAAYTGQTDWASSDDIDFMFNQEVSKPENATATTKWTYSPLKYWPTTQGDKISFFAYAPYAGKQNGAIEVKTKNNGTGIPEITYTINRDNLTEAEDFVADVIYDRVKADPNTNPDGTDETVEFNLKHELTRVSFAAKLDRNAFVDDNPSHKTIVNITKITFGGGKFVLSADYKFSEKVEVDANERGTWTPVGNGTSEPLDIDNLLATTTPSEGDFGGYVDKGIQLKTGGLEGNEELTSLFKEDEFLFLIPANGTSGLAADGDITITVEYDIVTVDAALSEGYSKTSAVKEIQLPSETLAQGTAYAYTLIFYLNEIVLKADVDEWNSGNWSTNVDWNDKDIK